MGASKRKQIVNGHAKAYIDAVFAERLREEGFVNLEDRSLCWYRVQSKDIINTICFYSPWNNIPLTLMMGYGIHPLFAEPYFTRSIYTSSNPPLDHGVFRSQTLIGPMPISRYSSEIMVYAPSAGNRGLETLDEIILPEMSNVKNLYDCYDLYKKRIEKDLETEPREDPSTVFRWFSTFIDLAIYLNDTEMYDAFAGHPDQLQRNAIYRNGRDEYLKTLEQKKEKNIAMLKRKFGILVE